MRRRRALMLFAGAALLAASGRARTQQSGRVRKIGMMGLTTPTNTDIARLFSSLLAELGWVEGRNVVFELRPVGPPESYPRHAEALVKLGVDVIMTDGGSGATRAAADATKRIPIVMNVSEDPVKAGFVASLAKPGGNITGVWIQNTEITSKRLAVLRELLPTATRIALLTYRGGASFDAQDETFGRLGFEAMAIDVREPQAIAKSIEDAVRAKAQVLIVAASWTLLENWPVIARVASQHRVPVIGPAPDLVPLGALMSFSMDEDENARVRASQVDRILRGAKPADLPVQQPSKFVMAISLPTAKALDVAVPQSLLLRADEVIR